jgi:hypothetical protein
MKSKEQVWYSNPELGLPPLTETRYITFPKDALVAAIMVLNSGGQRSLPPGKVEGCGIRADPDIVVSISIRDENTGELKQTDFPAETVGAAMIAYCRQVSVPLPRTAEKSLAVAGDNLMLCVHVKSGPTKLMHHLDARRFSAKK